MKIKLTAESAKTLGEALLKTVSTKDFDRVETKKILFNEEQKKEYEAKILFEPRGGARNSFNFPAGKVIIEIEETYDAD